MLTEYLSKAMKKAQYEFIASDRLFFSRIPGFKGLWSSAATRKACEQELRERLEDWVVLSLRMNMKLPVIDHISLNETLAPAGTGLAHAR